MEAISDLGNFCDWKISVVIPAHNEAKNLPYVLPLIPDCVHEVILVDDHSNDNTAEVARRALPTIRIVNAWYGRGKGVALQTGFAAATGDIIVMMDADGSSDPREIPRFIQALLSGAYFAKGSRFIGDGGSTDITPLRRLGSRILISIANQLFKTESTDMFCGLNAFWKDCLKFFEIDCKGFDVEMLIHLRACKANLEVVEVPSFEHSRIYGTSHFLTIKDGWKVLKMIMQEWMNGRSVVRTARVQLPSQQKAAVWNELRAIEQINIITNLNEDLSI